MRPSLCPASPAMTAAASGRRTMASSTCGFMCASSLQGIEVFDVDSAALAEQHDEDRKADSGLRRGDRQYEEHEDLAGKVAKIARESDEVEVRRKQQELDAHEKQNDVLAIDEDSRNRKRKENPREGEKLRERDHGRFAVMDFTRRTRSTLFTLTCRLMS